MIVPIVFSLDPLYEMLSLTWVFYKALTYANEKEKNGIVIAQAEYFNKLERQKELFPSYFNDETAQLFGYTIPTQKYIDETKKIEISNHVISEYINSFSSMSDAYIDSFKADIPELETFITNKIEEFESNGDKIDGFVTIRHYKFIENIAKKTHKKVFHFELAPFRNPTYKSYAYFDLDNNYKNYYSRFLEFAKSDKNEGIQHFTCEEIKAIFLEDDYLNQINKNNIEEFEIGLVGGYNTLSEVNAYTHYNMVEAYNRASEMVGRKEVIVRYHPGDPAASRVYAENVDNGSLNDFILKCKRIIAICSNVEFEAMLYGKPVYDETDISRFKGFINNNIQSMKERVASDAEINFLAFVCFVPYELVDDVNYIRWRLTNPSDIELFHYHRSYLLEKMHIDESILTLDCNERLDVILNIRKGIIAKNTLDRERRLVQLIRDNEDKTIQLERLVKENESLKIQLDELKIEQKNTLEHIESRFQDELNYEKERNGKHLATIQELSSRCDYLSSELSRINSSKSMKLTAPLRNIRSIIKR